MSTEKKIQDDIKDFLKGFARDTKFDVEVFKTHGNLYGGGLPDLLVFISPGDCPGVTVLFEVKRPGKKATPRQQAVIDRLKDLHILVAVVHSVREVQEFLAHMRIDT